MSEPRRPLRRDGPVLPTPTRLLYLAGPSAERDASTLQQLSALSGQVHLTTVTSASDVEQRIHSGGYHALVVSHGLPQAETLALISSLRKTNAPIAIVPVVTETQRDLYASAVAVGADDVLILLGGTLLHPTETLVRVRQSRYLPAHEVEAVRAAIRGVTVAPGGGPPAREPATPADVGEEREAREALTTFTSEVSPAAESAHEHLPQPPAARPPGLPFARVPQRPETPPVISSTSTGASTGAAAGHLQHEAVRRDLEARLSQAEAEAASRREAHAALVASKLDLERAVHAHRAERDGWERQRKELLAVVQTSNDAHAAERVKWEDARRDLERRAADADRAAGACRTAEAALEEARAAWHAAEQARATEREDWARARAQIEARVHDTSGARQESEALGVRTRTLEADLAAAAAALDVERAAGTEMRADVVRLREDLHVATRARDQLEETIAAARSDLRQLAEARQAGQTDFDAARAQADALRSELASATRVRVELEGKLDAFRAETTSATSARADLERQLEVLRAEVASGAGARATLERELEAARSDLQRTGEALASAQAAAEAAREALDARLAEAASVARAERTALEASLTALGADLERAIAAGASDRLALDVASEQLRAQRAELAALDRARLDAEAALAPARADRDAALDREAVARGEADAARATIDSLRAEVASLTDARDRSDRERADAQDALVRATAEAERASTDWRRDAELLREELSTAARATGHLEALLADVQADRQRLLDEQRADRAAWDTAREVLEGRLLEAEATAGTVAELQTALEALGETQATERMDWMTARLALETRLSQADDELERQREEIEALGAELARVASRYDRLARSELFGYAVTTLDGWLVHCNDAFARLLGYAHAREALASASEHAFGADGTDLIGASALAEGQVRYRDAFLTRVDGESVRVLQSALLVTGHGQDPLVERLVVDLGDRTAIEERLRAAQRLETLGRLAVAMGPELEALAALVDAGISAPLDPLDEGSETAAPSATVIEIRQLLAFIRKQSRPAGLIDLNDAVERISPMLARLVSSHVDIAIRLGPSMLIAADEEDFEQMATALVVAARDWLSAGGSLTVETGAGDVADTDRPPSIGVRSASGAVLTVTAAGYGVQLADPPPTLEAVVERCGGSLYVGGVEGRRVTLRVHLPKVR